MSQSDVDLISWWQHKHGMYDFIVPFKDLNALINFNYPLCMSEYWRVAIGIKPKLPASSLLLGFMLFCLSHLTETSVGGQCLTLKALIKMPYADSVASDQPAHPHSLTWELHCPLICRIGIHWLISGQCRSQVKLRRCAGWSGAPLSSYGRRQLL